MRLHRLPVIAVSVLAFSLVAPAIQASNDDNPPQSVTVSFGAGLNTARPGNPVNHHILPKVIKVRTGGVVNFVVAGLHWPRVYNPGTRPTDINLASPTGTAFLINDPVNLFYDGLNPGGPAGGIPSFFPLANAQNRVESVSFPTAGTYLVICNVRPHFNDGMFAFIKVTDVKDDETESSVVEMSMQPSSEQGHHH